MQVWNYETSNMMQTVGVSLSLWAASTNTAKLSYSFCTSAFFSSLHVFFKTTQNVVLRTFEELLLTVWTNSYEKVPAVWNRLCCPWARNHPFLVSAHTSFSFLSSSQQQETMASKIKSFMSATLCCCKSNNHFPWGYGKTKSLFCVSVSMYGLMHTKKSLVGSWLYCTICAGQLRTWPQHWSLFGSCNVSSTWEDESKHVRVFCISQFCF